MSRRAFGVSDAHVVSLLKEVSFFTLAHAVVFWRAVLLDYFVFSTYPAAQTLSDVIPQFGE